MLYNDLRSWMSKVDEFGELKTVEGIDWKYEMGAVTEVYARNPPYSAILFDKIKDYPAGHRVLVGVHHQSLKRQCLTTHLPLDYDRYQFIQAWRKRLNNPTYIPPRVVETGPVLENVYEGKDIDLYSLPVPHWHEEDGGRYIGTAHVVITRDMDEGWVNLGCYRVMVHDKDTLALYISPGKQGRIIRQKYFDQGRPCPVAISFGGRNVATVFSTMNMFGNLGAALFPVTAGWLVAETGDWNMVLFLFAGIMVIDAVCWAILNPKGTLFGDEE